jgi:nitrous oxidase accessory protein NosD
MYLWTSNNTVTGNAITESIVGILLSGNDNSITRNYLANNKNGVFFGSNQPGNVPSNVIISENCFVDNIRQLSGCVCVDYNMTEAKHTWDNGRIGNFWSDYKGTDSNGDGIGDTPYVIDVLNVDRYPLMQSPANPPKISPQISVEAIIVAVAALSIVAVASAMIFIRRRKKTETQDIM